MDNKKVVTYSSYNDSKHDILLKSLIEKNNLKQSEVSYRFLSVYSVLTQENVKNFFDNLKDKLGEYTFFCESFSRTIDYYTEENLNDDIQEKIDNGETIFIENDTHVYYLFNNCIFLVPLSTKLSKPTEKYIFCYYKTELYEIVKEVLSDFNKKFTLSPPEEKPGISIVSHTPNSGLDLNYIQFKDDVVIDIDKHYNDSLKKFDKEISSFLESKRSGLVLLHGQPGTGKTTYIRYLLTKHSNKKFVYIPNTHTHILTEPSFMDFLFEEMDNSILVIEEAERILESRDINVDNHHIAALLNTSDGIIGSLLNIKIICTFNGEFNKIDKALLRKGRLVGSYQFEPLEVKKCQIILDELNIDKKVDEPMTLADIYNVEKELILDSSINSSPKIGFAR